MSAFWCTGTGAEASTGFENANTSIATFTVTDQVLCRLKPWVVIGLLCSGLLRDRPRCFTWPSSAPVLPLFFACQIFWRAVDLFSLSAHMLDAMMDPSATSVSPLDSPIYKNLFGTEEIRDVFSERSCIRVIVQTEAALARAQSLIGVIPEDIGPDITTALAHFQVE